MILVCSGCRRDQFISEYDPTQTYFCGECKSILTAQTVIAGDAPPADTDLPVPKEVLEARDNPANRIGGCTLVMEIGRGGAGVVYKAWDDRLGRWVAVKTVHPGASSAEDVVRFRREGKVAARLEHPNIASIHDVGVDRGQHFIVMKFVDGRTLEKSGVTDVTEVVRVVREACRGVAFAHQSGIVHRDLKPQNIMIDKEGRVFVLDFGLAKTITPGNVSVTATQGYMGTPAFMAPEQARGLLKEIDTRTDVYALGATIWSVLAGRFPHPGESPPDIMVRIATDPTPSIRSARKDAPPALEAILLKAMAKERDQRYKDAVEFGAALDEFLKNPAARKRSPGWVAFFLLIPLGLAAWFVYGRKKPEPPKPEPIPRRAAAAVATETPEEAKDPAAFHETRSWNAHEGWVMSVAVHGKRIATGGQDHRVRIWDEEGKLVDMFEGHPGPVSSVAFSPDGRRLASAGGDHVVRLWDLETKQARVLEGHGRTLLGVMSVAFHPNGRVLASGGYDGVIKLWDAETGAAIATLPGHTKAVSCLAFSSSLLASASYDTTVRVWEPATGTELRQMTGHTGWVWCVAFDATGGTLASAGADGRIRLWNANTAKELRLLEGHTGSVKRVAFGESQLYSCGDDATVRVWDPASGKELKRLTGHSDVVWCVTPAGAGRIVTSSADRTVRMWGR